MDGSAEQHAEQAAAFIHAWVLRKRGKKAGQGAWPRPFPCHTLSPMIRQFAVQRFWRVTFPVACALCAWADGMRRVVLLRHVPAPLEILGLQSVGWRCVSLLSHGQRTSPHEGALEFALHDLCHLEKFADERYHLEQVGFFSCMEAALRQPAWSALDEDLDAQWIADRNAILCDMNGSVVFLFAALKMRLKMAVRRRLARSTGRSSATAGPLNAQEEAAFLSEMETRTRLMGLDGAWARAAHAVSKRRDAPYEAALLREHFIHLGRQTLAHYERVSPGRAPASETGSLSR
jgi:hypothetical protein